MKKIVLGIGALALSFAAQAANFSEGKDYTVLKNQPRLEQSVVKVYSVYCPFCYKYEKSVTPMLVEKYGSKFSVWHLTSKGDYGVAATKLLAAATVTDEAKFKAAKMAFYSANFDKKTKFKNEAEFLEVGLKAAGMTRAEMDAAAAKPEAQALIKLWDEKALPVARVQGVPALVVNGQYLIKTSAVTSMDALKNLVDHLLTK